MAHRDLAETQPMPALNRAKIDVPTAFETVVASQERGPRPTDADRAIGDAVTPAPLTAGPTVRSMSLHGDSGADLSDVPPHLGARDTDRCDAPEALDPAGPRAETQEIAQQPSPPAGAPTIPGYTILRALGRGGMAEVWLAEKLGTAGVPVRCVVKTILRDFATTDGFQDRFLDEARIVAALRHANITSVLDVGRTEEAPYLAMEWCDGTDANKLIKAVRGRGVHIPLRHCMWILREALQGLHHAHTARGSDGTPLGIVHRDISPANVLIGRSGAVKIADFGVARAVLSTRPERRGTVAGKAHYFAPELFRGAPASASTDVFAMGVVFYELCTLQPFVDRRLSLPEVKERILSFREQEIVEGDLTLPNGIERIFLRALAHDPAMRYASALAFLEDVNDYVYESGLRLLDAFFAEWVQRTLDGSAPEGRRPLLAGGSP